MYSFRFFFCLSYFCWSLSLSPSSSPSPVITSETSKIQTQDMYCFNFCLQSHESASLLKTQGKWQWSCSSSSLTYRLVWEEISYSFFIKTSLNRYMHFFLWLTLCHERQMYLFLTDRNFFTLDLDGSVKRKVHVWIIHVMMSRVNTWWEKEQDQRIGWRRKVESSSSTHVFAESKTFCHCVPLRFLSSLEQDFFLSCWRLCDITFQNTIPS